MDIRTLSDRQLALVECENRNYDAVKQYLNNKYHDEHLGLLTLSLATTRNEIDFVRILLNEQNGEDIDFVDDNGCTALMYACNFAHMDIISLLLKRGANAEIEDRCGLTCLLNALLSENYKIINELI